MLNFLDHAAYRERIDRIIDDGLSEDVGTGDHTTLATIPSDRQGMARCLVKQNGTLAGVALAEYLYKKVDSDVAFSGHILDGSGVFSGDVAFFVQGSIQTLLRTERLMLNLLQRMSGIATLTAQVVAQLEGTQCKVLDTRKTTPLIRVLEKWAVVIGGGVNHRWGLYDMILIKDNHTDSAGGILPALQAATAYQQANQLDVPVEIEVRSLAELQEALSFEGRLDRILLDNMALPVLNEAVQMVGGSIPTEASGSITMANARLIAKTGVDFISMGALTHSAPALDISLKLVES